MSTKSEKVWIVNRPRAWPIKNYSSGKTLDDAHATACRRWAKEHGKPVDWSHLAALGYWPEQRTITYEVPNER